jgi:hypothetical protein
MLYVVDHGEWGEQDFGAVHVLMQNTTAKFVYTAGIIVYENYFDLSASANEKCLGKNEGKFIPTNRPFKCA